MACNRFIVKVQLFLFVFLTWLVVKRKWNSFVKFIFVIVCQSTSRTTKCCQISIFRATNSNNNYTFFQFMFFTVVLLNVFVGGAPYFFSFEPTAILCKASLWHTVLRICEKYLRIPNFFWRHFDSNQWFFLPILETKFLSM